MNWRDGIDTGQLAPKDILSELCKLHLGKPIMASSISKDEDIVTLNRIQSLAESLAEMHLMHSEWLTADSDLDKHKFKSGYDKAHAYALETAYELGFLGEAK